MVEEVVSIIVLVEKGKNKVVYAEAGNDFVDVLFSFLLLPLGTIARLVSKESNIEAVPFGSISSLYQSVSNLDEQYLWSKTCKEILLMPNGYMFLQNLKLTIDDTPLLNSCFFCENEHCSFRNKRCLSFFRNQKCKCGKLLNREKPRQKDEKYQLLKNSSTFIVSDDLFVMPNLIGTSLNLLQKHGINDFDAIDKQTINITKKEVIDLLKLSLFSKTPLSDFIMFKKEQFLGTLNPRNRLRFRTTGKESDKMVVKLVRRKSNKQILFVEADNDFAHFIFSFLTFPLGGVLHMLQGFSILCSIHNLYKSLIELSSSKGLSSQKFKNFLINPPVLIQLELGNQILPIRIRHIRSYKETYKSFDLVDPKSPISGGYAYGSIKFMVTDDLVVTPMSSIDGISYLQRMKVPFNDVEEMVINIGKNEGFSILQASLTSTSVLTNSLNQYIGSKAAQADLSSNASLKDRPLKKLSLSLSLSLLHFISFVCYPFRSEIDTNGD